MHGAATQRPGPVLENKGHAAGEVSMTTDATLTAEVCHAPATELARRIRDRELSSAEVTEVFLACIAARNHDLNAIVHVFDADARSRARQADEALARGESWGA